MTLNRILLLLFTSISCAALAYGSPFSANTNRVLAWNAGSVDDRANIPAAANPWATTPITGDGTTATGGALTGINWTFENGATAADQGINDQHIDGVSSEWHIDGTYDWNQATQALGTTTAPSFNAGGISGTDYTTQSAAFEIWFRPGAATGTRVLFETGDDANGVSITTNGQVVQLAVNDSAAADVPLTIDYSLALTNGIIDPSEFIQVVAVIDLDNSGLVTDPNDSVHLYLAGVNSTPPNSTGDTGTVVSAAGLTLTDWAGTGGSGLGHDNATGGAGAFAGAGDLSSLTYGNFDNEIAYFNFYSNAGSNALTQAQIVQNYNAVVPEPGTWAFLIVGTIGLIGFDQRRRRKAKAAESDEDVATEAEVCTADLQA